MSDNTISAPIAITRDNPSQYVVLKDGQIISGPHSTAASAIKAREKLSGERERRRE